MELVQLLGSQGFWEHQVLREIGCRKYSVLEGYGNQYWPIHSSILDWKTTLPDREAWQARVYRLTKSWTLLKQSHKILLCRSVHQAHRGPPPAGVLLCASVHQALKGAPCMESYSVVQCIRCLMGQPLYCSAVDDGLWWERGFGDGSTPYMATHSSTLAWKIPWTERLLIAW